MFLSPGQIVRAVLGAILLVVGLWWCREIIRRWRDDVAELKRPDDILAKAVIVFFWLVTLAIVVVIVKFVWGVVQSIVTAFR